jgi:hypothetical protein
MTLALLLTAVGGAWAQDTYTVTFKANGNTKTVENVTLPYTFKCDFNTEEGELDLIIHELYGLSGGCCGDDAPTSSGSENVTCGSDGLSQFITISAPFEGTATVNGIYEGETYQGFYYSLEITCAVHEPTEWSLTPDETGKKWTLAKMPASNIELQVEYYAESNLFLSKDALADKANITVTAGETTVEFGDDGKSTNTVTEGNTVTTTYTGTKKILGMKVAKVDLSNAYLKWDADQKKLVATEIPAEATKVENSTSYVEWSGTYVVEGNVTITGNITLSGNVNLIIKDGATLTAKKIIGYNNNLSIYGQANQTGQLVVDNPGDDAITSMKTFEVHSAKVTATSSYSDRGALCYIGTFNVYGGSVDAKNTGSKGGYGIWLGGNGPMNIYGGEVKAVGKGNGGYSYGITANNSSTVTVNGGKLWAENADKQAINTSSITLTKGTGFTGKIEYSSDNSTWSETVDADAKYVRAE